MQQTKVHVKRLERVFEMLGQEPKATKCKAMKGILDEGEDTISEKGSSETMDVAIIMSAQKVEHYEIAAYGSLAAWADMLGLQDVKQLFGQTLDEEKAADEKLTELAKAGLNQRAASKQPEKQFAE